MFVESKHNCFGRDVRLLKVVLISGLGWAQFSGCARGLDERIDRAYALARNPTPGNKNRIEALLQDPDRDMRATAVVLMETIDTERAQQMAKQALQDPDGLVRAAAVTALASAADPATISTLSALASDDPVWQVRSRVLETIVPSDDPAVREKFAHALSDPVRHVRRAALRAGIVHTGLLPADRLLALVVADPDWENRVDAARALGASNDPAAYPGLDAALADPNEFVRATAAKERRALTASGVVR